jgi:hypothetical protein
MFQFRFQPVTTYPILGDDGIPSTRWPVSPVHNSYDQAWQDAGRASQGRQQGKNS